MYVTTNKSFIAYMETVYFPGMLEIWSPQGNCEPACSLTAWMNKNTFIRGMCK